MGCRLERMVVAIWLDFDFLLLTDLHSGNIMRDSEGRATIIDALHGRVAPTLFSRLRWLRDAEEDARAFREGRPRPSRGGLPEAPDDEL